MISKFAKKPAPVTSRYAGIQTDDRVPLPDLGTYKFKVLYIAEGHNPATGCVSFKTTLIVVVTLEGKMKPGTEVFIPNRVKGPGESKGRTRVKELVMAFAGYGDQSEYDEFDPQGLFIQACTGEAVDGYPDTGITGREAVCTITRGNATADGNDFYRVFSWEPIQEKITAA